MTIEIVLQNESQTIWGARVAQAVGTLRLSPLKNYSQSGMLRFMRVRVLAANLSCSEGFSLHTPVSPLPLSKISSYGT